MPRLVPLGSPAGCGECGLKVLEWAAGAFEALKWVGRRAASGDGLTFRACREDALEELAGVAQAMACALSALGCEPDEWEQACEAAGRAAAAAGRDPAEGAGALLVEWEAAE